MSVADAGAGRGPAGLFPGAEEGPGEGEGCVPDAAGP